MQSGTAASPPSPTTTLAPDDRIDRDLVRSHLRGRAILADWGDWRRLPDTYVQPGLSGVFALFLRRLHPEGELVSSAVARLEAVPELLDAGRANLDAGLVSEPIVGRGVRLCRAAASYVRDLVPLEVDDDDGRARLAEAGAGPPRPTTASAPISPTSRRGPAAASRSRSRGTPPCSARRSCWRTTRPASGNGAPGLRRSGRRDERRWPGNTGTPRTTGRSFTACPTIVPRPRRRSAPATSGRPSRRTSSSSGTTWSRCRTANTATSCRRRPSSGRCSPSPRISVRPCTATSLTGRFNVPYPPDGTSEDEVAQRLATNCYAEMPTISVHEAYPGHHWHMVRMQAVRAADRPVRCILTTPYFSEGWALYAELMMREQGFFTDPAPRTGPPRRPPVPSGPDRRRHQPSLRRDGIRRGGDVHARPGRAHRARGPGRGHPVLRLAHPGVGLPDGVLRDRAAAADAGSPTRPATWCRSTTRSAEPAPCPSPSPSGPCSRREPAVRAGRAGSPRSSSPLRSRYPLGAGCARNDGRTMAAPPPGSRRRRPTTGAQAARPAACRPSRCRARRSPTAAPIPGSHLRRRRRAAPDLTWTAPPSTSVELALVLVDADAANAVLWVVAGLPAPGDVDERRRSPDRCRRPRVPAAVPRAGRRGPRVRLHPVRVAGAARHRHRARRPDEAVARIGASPAQAAQLTGSYVR